METVGILTREGGGLQPGSKGRVGPTPHRQVLHQAIPVKGLVLGQCCCLSGELVIFQCTNRTIGGEQLADGGLILEHDQCSVWECLDPDGHKYCMFHASNQLSRLVTRHWLLSANQSWQRMII